MPNTLPFGTQFSPNQIELPQLLQLVIENEGDDTAPLITAIVDTFFSANSAGQQRNMAGNCKNSLVSYGILESGGGVHITAFGHQLYEITDETEQCEALVKHILKNLNGMILIDVLRGMHRNGERISKENVVEALNSRGFDLSRTSNNVPVMKLWLNEAGVLRGWRIDEHKLSELTELSEGEYRLLRTLRPEQYYFLRALCNTASENYQRAADVRQLATATYGITFVESSFSQSVIHPLTERGLIEIRRATEGHGARTPLVRLTELTKRDIILPLLQQLEGIIDREVIEYLQKPLDELRADIDSADTYLKGLALEAFAIRIMRIIGLDFIQTRLKGNETAGAEVDVLFDSSRLLYSRWQVQCKNTHRVSLDQVAKEVGLSHVLKTNAIVIMTTGVVTEKAREYATQIMKTMNLCIIMVEGSEIDAIIAEPTKILEIFNRESLNAKHIKVFE